ncbi:MAG TPA: diaminopimelate epimerase [Prolixibacteraceae bacterium]|nr:diaminopimelate epimerase [Prolixibacteraceae bacterium]
MDLKFYKYQGAGNDFIMIDNRDRKFDVKNEKLIEFLCHRRFGIGADGLIALSKAQEFDFKMSYFNSDGKEAEMCGNGGRCIAAFAKKLGIINNEAHFLAFDGEHHAIIDHLGLIMLEMTNVHEVKSYVDGYFLNTGVPHLVHFVDELKSIDVNIEGRQLRYDARFQPAGTNVNFVKQNDNHLTVYTYERGVEGETLACGTGITASALSAATREGKHKGVYFITAKGGSLEVSFEREGDMFKNIWLKGPAELVYTGMISTSELKLDSI